MNEFGAILQPVINWAYAIFDQIAGYDGRLMFISGLISSFVLSHLVSWITNSALRLAIIGGVMASAVVGLVTTLPKQGTQPNAQPPSMEQLAKQIPQPQSTGQPIRLTPPAQPQTPQASQTPVRRN